MKKVSAMPKKNSQKVPKMSSPDGKVAANSDVPPPKKESKPVPPPDYTLEELLENIPEPSSKVRDPGFSGEVDTGRPVGKEVW